MRFPSLAGLTLATFVMAGSVFAESKPVIGINMAISDSEALSNVSLSVRSTYVDAVLAAGGTPIILPPVLSLEMADVYAEMVDGFVFVGGPDINPARFGQEPHELWNPINPRREEFDFALMEAALETRKPVLAVCLGMQMLNVSQGGSMIQDIPDLAPSDIDHRPRQSGSELAHDVQIVAGTRLHELLGTTTLRVNSIHHQACAVTPTARVIVSATAPDGIVEGIEIPDHPFAIGVQWHPEFLTDEGPHINVFKGLVAEAKAGMAESEQQPAAALSSGN